MTPQTWYEYAARTLEREQKQEYRPRLQLVGEAGPEMVGVFTRKEILEMEGISE